jgi:hypothetical protein
MKTPTLEISWRYNQLGIIPSKISLALIITGIRMIRRAIYGPS